MPLIPLPPIAPLACDMWRTSLFVILVHHRAAALGDPLGGCTLTPELYAHLTYMVKGLAPTLLLLEGGYNLDVTARWVNSVRR